MILKVDKTNVAGLLAISELFLLITLIHCFETIPRREVSSKIGNSSIPNGVWSLKYGCGLDPSGSWTYPWATSFSPGCAIYGFGPSSNQDDDQGGGFWFRFEFGWVGSTSRDAKSLEYYGHDSRGGGDGTGLGSDRLDLNRSVIFSWRFEPSATKDNSNNGSTSYKPTN